jgi:hypothetical protein
MASQFEAKYRFTGRVDLSNDTFNRVFRDLDARTTALEAAIDNLDAARDKLVELGLDQLNSQIDAAIEGLQSLINGANADLTDTQTEINDLNSQLAALDAAFDAIIAGGSLPATAVTVSAIPGIVSAHVQGALAELQGDINAANALIAGLQKGAIVVANVTARNALTGLAKGNIVFVQDDGAGKWAEYQITSDGNGTWSGVSKTNTLNQDAYFPVTGGTLSAFLHVFPTPATPTKALRVSTWAEVSGGADARAVFASNLYSHYNGVSVEYRTANAHATAGYAAIRMVQGTLEFAGASGATTADASVTPTWNTLWHAGNFTPATKANLAGDTFTGDISISKTAGNQRQLFIKSATLVRWAAGADASVEGGSNAGSNFAIGRFSDAGSFVANSLTIARNSGNATFEAQVLAASFNTTSDRRLKTAIKDFALAGCRKVLDLAPVTFRFKRKKQTEIGLIAQDVLDHMPEVVVADDDGMLSINYGSVVAALLGVVKDQERRIVALEAALAAK